MIDLAILKTALLISLVPYVLYFLVWNWRVVRIYWCLYVSGTDERVMNNATLVETLFSFDGATRGAWYVSRFSKHRAIKSMLVNMYGFGYVVFWIPFVRTWLLMLFAGFIAVGGGYAVHG